MLSERALTGYDVCALLFVQALFRCKSLCDHCTEHRMPIWKKEIRIGSTSPLRRASSMRMNLEHRIVWVSREEKAQPTLFLLMCRRLAARKFCKHFLFWHQLTFFDKSDNTVLVTNFFLVYSNFFYFLLHIAFDSLSFVEWEYFVSLWCFIWFCTIF